MKTGDWLKFVITRLVPFFILLMAFPPISVSRQQQDSPAPQQTQTPATTPAIQESSKLMQISSPEFEVAVANLATEIQQRDFKAVAVIGAMGPEDQITELGPALGDVFSADLARLAYHFRVIDRADLRGALKRERISEAMLISDSLDDWIAEKAKADGFVEIKIWSVNDDQVALTASLSRCNGVDGELVLIRRAIFGMNPEQQKAVAQPLNSNWNKDSFPSDKSKPAPEEFYPKCASCPRPDMTDALRRYLDDHKEIGEKGIEINLFVTVLIDGTVDDIAVVKSFRYGINASSVECLRSWKFMPGRDEKGNVIPVRTRIQMTYQTF